MRQYLNSLFKDSIPLACVVLSLLSSQFIKRKENKRMAVLVDTYARVTMDFKANFRRKTFTYYAYAMK